MMPILLYGCENWIVSEKLLRQLESFQGEMGKKLSLQKQVGCFNHSVVTLVADKLKTFAFFYHKTTN